MHHGIFIDILPMDYISPNLYKRSIDRLLLRTLITMCYAKIGIYPTKNRVFALLAKALSIVFPLRTLRTLTETLSKKYESRPTGVVCSPLSPYALCTSTKDVFPVEFFGEPSEIEFEGHHFSAPTNPDKILRQIYGDYMTPPPEEQRLLRHNITELKT